jgi:molybdate transport system permease protein
LRRSALIVAAAAGVAFVAVPFVGLAIRTPWVDLIEQMQSAPAQAALRLSLATSLAATVLCLVVGTPLAWVLARHQFPFRRLARALVTVPMVLPPVVAGVALLAVFGRTSGIIGEFLFDAFGTQLTFSPAGVVVAETFVALPFYVIAAESGIASVDRRYEHVAATLGGGPRYVAVAVTLRMAAPSLAAGLILAWARALGEFGATITFAGNIEGRTRTLPLAVYELLESDPQAAFALSVLMVLVAVGVLVALRGNYLTRRS